MQKEGKGTDSMAGGGVMISAIPHSRGTPTAKVKTVTTDGSF